MAFGGKPQSYQLPPIMNPNGNVVENATIQKKPEKQITSLYEQTMSMITKLYAIPEFEVYLFPEGVDAILSGSESSVIDPIAILWHCFRLGAPLCHLFNQLKPKSLLPVPDISGMITYTNICKKSVFHFLVGIKAELGFEGDTLFTISELYSDDMNKLVKVIATVDIVLNEIDQRGLTPPPRSLPFSTSSASIDMTDNRSKAIAELLSTERTFVASMHKLMEFQELLIKNNTVSKDVVHSIFSNLGELLDFQRRFLFSLEATLVLPAAEQDIGAIFIQYEQGFYVYEAMVANYSSAIEVVREHQAALASVNSLDPIREVQALLIQPVQRICRYPLILKEIIKLSSPDTFQFYDSLVQSLEVIKTVTDRVNEVQRMDENKGIKKQLINYVDDWQNLNVDELGDLLLYDRFPIAVQDNDQLFHIYLFEQVLLCCRDDKDSKKSKSWKSGKSDAEPIYEIKGKIYTSSICDILDQSDEDMQVFQLKLYWNNMEDSFILRCRNIEQIRLWKDRIANVSGNKNRHGKLQRSLTSTDLGNVFTGRPSLKPIQSVGDSVDGRQRSLSQLGMNRASTIEGRERSLSNKQRSGRDNLDSFRPAAFGGFPSNSSDNLNSGPPSAPLPKAPTHSLPPPARNVVPTQPPRSALPQAPNTSVFFPPNSPLPHPPRGPPNSTLPQRPPSSALPNPPSGPPKSPLPPSPVAPSLPLPRAPSNHNMAPPKSPLPPTPNSGGPPGSPLPQPPTRAPSSSNMSSSRTTSLRAPAAPLIKMKTHYGQDIFILAVPSVGCKFTEILEKIEKKIKVCGAALPAGRRIRLRYKDEDGDLININSDEDIEMAFDIAKKSSTRATVVIIVE